MKKYLKAAAGIAGVLVGALVAVNDTLPASYRPYVAVVVALATGLGIWHAPYVASAPKTVKQDAGAGDISLVVVCAAVSIVVLAAVAKALHLV